MSGTHELIETGIEVNSLNVTYSEETDQIIVLREGVAPQTLNLPSPRSNDEFTIWRHDTTCPQVVGYFINAASVTEPKLVNAIQNPDQIEGVKEYFVQKLLESNRFLNEVLLEFLAARAQLRRANTQRQVEYA